MVKRYWKYAAGLLLVLALGLTIGVAWWLLATTSGARWLVEQLPAVLTVERVEGRLCDRLRLSGIAVDGAEGALAVEQLELSWRPAALSRGKLLVTELTVAGVTVSGAWSSPEAEPSQPVESWRWPELPGWLRRVRAEIKQLDLQRLRWQRSDQPPLTLDRVAGRIKWTGQRLEVGDLSLLTSAGELTASLEARWRKPSLKLKASARFKDLAGEPAELGLALELQPVRDAEGFAGPIHLSASSVPSGELDLAGRLELTSRQIALKDLALRQVGARGRVAGDLRLAWAAEPLEAQADLVFEQLDLRRFTGQATDLGGTVQLAGSVDDYRGQFALTNRAEGWQALRLASAFAGNRSQVALTGLDADLLRGQLQGRLTAAWQPELRVEGQLSGRNLDPSAYRADWPGTVNLEMAGSFSQPADQPMELRLQGRLLDSLLRGYPLQGRVDGRLLGSDLELEALELQGAGVSVSAHGALRKRVNFRVGVADLATLLPQAAGTLQGSGWLRWKDRQLTGEVQGSGQKIHYRDLDLQSASFVVDRRSAQGKGRLKLRLGQLQKAGLPAIDGQLQAFGTVDNHQADVSLRLAGETSIDLGIAGSYRQEVWQGRLQRLVLQDKTGPWRLVRPVAVDLSARALRFDGLLLRGTAEEELAAAADLQLQPFSGKGHAQWRQISLARANPWLPSLKLSGQSSGQAELNWPADAAPQLSARVEVSGRLVQDRLTIGVERGFADLAWDRSGLKGELQIALDDGGRLEGNCLSPEPAALRLPQNGQWQLQWQDLDLGRLQSFLPVGVTAVGRLAGRTNGSWAPDGSLSAAGSAEVEGGRLVGALGEGRIALLLKTGRFDWDWHDRQLQGGASLVLEEYGRLDGRFQLPLPARLPLTFEPQGSLNASVTGKVRETGLITVLFPGVLQETRGRLEIDLVAAGQWQQPVLRGSLQLLDAGAYVPSAGIELRDIAMRAELSGDLVRFSSFSLRSGPGLLQGQGTLRLENWRPASYRATLEGEGFQLINLPELQLLVTPNLSLQGTPRGLAVSGTLTVPEILLHGSTQTAALAPSEDVIIVGQEPPAEPAERFALQADIGLLLGEHVLIKAKGLDARLTGRLDLTASGVDQLRAKGRIAVAEGNFSAYGAKLDIQRGQLLFNGPVEEPTLDILAIRTVRKVKAGVRVTGTPQAPNITLYSDPAMTDSDRLAYIVLGRPLARNSGEADLMMTAAGAMLSEGESVVLQDRLKRQLGLDALGFEAGDDEGDVAASMLTIGKYLSPNLYVSIGQSLFTETSEFRMRYSLGENWELESMTGTESGVDLFYKIEFR